MAQKKKAPMEGGEMKELADNISKVALASILAKVKEKKPLTAAELKWLKETQADSRDAGSGKGFPLLLNQDTVQSARATGEALATLTGLTDRRIRQLGLPKEKHGVYLLKSSILKILSSREEGATPAEDPATLKIKLRKLTAEARLKEMELEKAQGSMLDAEEVAKEWARLFTGVKQRLQSLPNVLASALVGTTSFPEAKRRVEEEVFRALEEAAATVTAVEPAPPKRRAARSRRAKASGKTHRKSVGRRAPNPVAGNKPGARKVED